MFAKRIGFVLLLFLLSINAFAQKPDDAEKEKLQRQTKLLEQVLSDAQNLRLPENRALVFARVGTAFWKIDEKQARKLFQDAINNLLTAQTEAENEKNGKQFFQNLIYGQSPRMDIINFIASCDAEFALEVLTKTRPARITQALAGYNDENQTSIQQYARNEITSEQRLAGLVAEQNPQLAIKRVRESLKKGATYETINLLRKIYVKEPETANQLAEELIQNFLATDFSNNYQMTEMVGYFISELGREKQPQEKVLSVSDKLVRDLAVKLVDTWLNPKTKQFYGYWNSIEVIGKLFPDRSAQIKQKQEKINSQYQTQESLDYTKLTQSDATPDELVAQAEKFSSSYKNEIYRVAADKYVQNGNVAQAERIISTGISDEESERYLSQFYANLANQAISQEKFDDANNYISRITDDNQRINSLINLANRIFQKNQTENRKWALSVLDQARAIIPDAPETQYDFNNVMNLATAYAPIEPQESFSLIESLTPSLNELVQANFILARFRNYGGYRQGELQMTAGNYLGVYNLENVLRNLKDKDFDRTLQFTSGFNRLETRISLQLQLIDENLTNGNYITNLPIDGRNFLRY